jgi:primary-amine oxidase
MPASAVFAKGNTIDWRNWNLRFGFNLREGLVLHQIAWNDGNRLRSIAYRASVAEVATIYGDPDDYWSWMEVFDEGVLGLGYLSVPVKPGREIPATAATLNTLQPDAGEPRFSREMPDRIYLYERDAGNLFYSRQSERLVHYRGTELVVGFVSALGNYTYNFSWIFRSDGSFGFEVELAGQIATKFGAQTDRLNAAETASELPVLQSFGDSPYGTCVSRGVLGVNHQHWFSLRIDFDIDGTRNAAAERNLEIGRSVIDGRERVGLSSKTVSLQSARDAKRSRNDDLARSWIIYSSEIKAIENKISGYEIVPKTNTVPALPAERQNTAPAFAFHHFWVTPYRDDELYAAGEYPNQARREGVDNLYYYANDDSVLNTDIVAWYTLGVTHIPRPEDFPLMPASRHSVLFQPFGFLSSQ